MVWSVADLRGKNLKKLFTPKKLSSRSWCGSSAKRTQGGRYVLKVDRRNGREWNYFDYLDPGEADVAVQFHHDWALSGLREIAAVDYATISADHSFLYGGQVTRKSGYGDWNRDDRYSGDTGWHDNEYSVSEDPDAVEAGDDGGDEPVLANPPAGRKTVEQLVTECIWRGGQITRCSPYARSRKVRLETGKKLPREPVWEEPVITRPSVTPLPARRAQTHRITCSAT
jgi:hypothetical protein